MKKMQSSDLIDGLSKGLKADSDGNVTVGKNLEVDGIITINTGDDGLYFNAGEKEINLCVDGETGSFTIASTDGSFSFDLSNYGIFDSISGNYFVRENQLPKYYAHDLLLSGANGNSVIRLSIISSKDLNCDSIQDLRSLLGITSVTAKSFAGYYYDTLEDYNNQFGPVTVAAVFISTTLCQIHSSGTDEGANITTVSDTVTPL